MIQSTQLAIYLKLFYVEFWQACKDRVMMVEVHQHEEVDESVSCIKLNFFDVLIWGI